MRKGQLTMSQAVTVLQARSIFTPFREIRDGFMALSSGKIVALGSGACQPRGEHVATVDFSGYTIVPGFIDLHHHGAMGHRASDGSMEALQAIAEFLPSTGTTGWLPTVNDLASCRAIRDFARQNVNGAKPLGIHLEGPFLAPKNLPGTEYEVPIKADIEVFDELYDASGGLVRLVGIAPELEGALELIAHMRDCGVVPACAHTKADHALWLRAVDAGLQHVTHTYNVMTGLHHRRPGVVGGALTTDCVTCELIGDGFHVSPVAIDILIRCKGIDNIVVITDSVRYAGLPDGQYDEVTKKAGIIRRVGFDESVDGSMAGSAWTMDHNVRYLVQDVGLSLADVLRMTSTVPARIAGFADSKGSLQVGKDADFTILDENLEIVATFASGKQVFART